MPVAVLQTDPSKFLKFNYKDIFEGCPCGKNHVLVPKPPDEAGPSGVLGYYCATKNKSYIATLGNHPIIGELELIEEPYFV